MTGKILVPGLFHAAVLVDAPAKQNEQDANGPVYDDSSRVDTPTGHNSHHPAPEHMRPIRFISMIALVSLACDSAPDADEPPADLEPKTVTYRLTSTADRPYPDRDDRQNVAILNYYGPSGFLAQVHLDSFEEPWEITIPYWDGPKGFGVYWLNGESTLTILVDDQVLAENVANITASDDPATGGDLWLSVWADLESYAYRRQVIVGNDLADARLTVNGEPVSLHPGRQVDTVFTSESTEFLFTKEEGFIEIDVTLLGDEMEVFRQDRAPRERFGFSHHDRPTRHGIV